MSIAKKIVSLKDIVGKTENQIFLVVGPPGTRKTDFCIKYMIDGFSENNTSAYLTTDRFPKEITNKIKESGVDPNQHIESNKLQFIDAFSYRIGVEVKEEANMVDNIRDLTELSVFIKKLADSEEKLRLIIDSISTLTVFSREIAILDFIQTQISRLKYKNHSGIILAHEGIMNDSVLQGLKAFVDGVIEFKLEEDQQGALEPKIRVVHAPEIIRPGWLQLFH
jgi:KaiC/GvpD/RAD55 family RecA-like ATPase